MKLENMREEFPKMPDDIREMIENEVARQVKIPSAGKEEQQEVKVLTLKQTETTGKNPVGKQAAGKKRLSGKKIAVLFCAAALAVGTTTFAGSALYKVYNEKIGKFGVGTTIQVGEKGSTYGQVPEELEQVKVVNHYIPEGMVQYDPGKMFYEETPYLGGISMACVTMDTKVTRDDVMMVDRNVKYSEILDISGHEAVYLEKSGWPTDELWFDKKMYVIYPESWKVLEVFGGSDISKEEMKKIVENTELQPTGETYHVKDVVTWSDWVTPETDVDTSESVLSVSGEEIADIYEIGEEFELLYVFDEKVDEVEDIFAKVTNVQVADDLTLLGDSPYIEDSWKREIGEDGKLKQAEIQYVKSGDGIDSQDELIKTEMVKQKLVYITVEYTNHGEKTLENILYQFSLIGMREIDGEYVIYDRAELEPDAEWDAVYNRGESRFGEIEFYDLHGGERDNNYIPLMRPGETVTVHFAQIVNEDELGYMYLNLGNFSSGTEFTAEELKQGYVDIRQGM